LAPVFSIASFPPTLDAHPSTRERKKEAQKELLVKDDLHKKHMMSNVSGKTQRAGYEICDGNLSR
jgi:hypothetical protein